MTALQRVDPLTEGWDEAYEVPVRPREHYRALMEALENLGWTGLERGVRARIERGRVRFGSQALAMCPIPRLITHQEWELVSAGVAQRVAALSRFIEDCYAERRIVCAGIVPERVIDTATGYEPDLRRRAGPAFRLGVVGLDIVRDSDGELLVLEDNTRTPSGFTYASAMREALSSTLDDLGWSGVDGLRPPAPLAPQAREMLRATISAAAQSVAGEGQVVVLTDGPQSSAYFEHQVAARWLGAPLVRLDDLVRRGDEVWLRATDSRRACRVAVVYRRTDQDAVRERDGALTTLATLLLEPWLEGRLAIVNGFGTAIGDDKLVHAYVEDMISFYLGEAPLLRSVQTLDLAQPPVLEQVLDDLPAYVVKPRFGHGGHGVVVCGHAEDHDVRALEAALRRSGAARRYVAQPLVALSVHPTVVRGRLGNRHIDLRPFAFVNNQGVSVMPGGLTRVALDAGALVVNSSQRGGAKDTWVLT